jgi:hypothetical protein
VRLLHKNDICIPSGGRIYYQLYGDIKFCILEILEGDVHVKYGPAIWCNESLLPAWLTGLRVTSSFADRVSGDN